ncbi:MAG TPA: response regulator [Methylomirabilota bacterium]|nr:response regulator [Methylomirabilota bacterium]
MESVRPVILLVENDDADVFLFRRALQRLRFKGTLRVVTFIAQAHDYLKRRGEFTDESYYPLPDLIVSDMNLHGETGNDFLTWLRKDARLGEIPFIFYSGSFTESQRQTSMGLNPEGFYPKTADMDEMTKQLASILKFLPRPELK